MFRWLANLSMAVLLVLVSSMNSASAQTPKYKLVKVNVTNPSSPYTVHVGDIIQLNLTNQNVGNAPIPSSSVVAGTGNALSPVGPVVLDTTSTPSTYVAFYSVVSLGGSTIQFVYDDTSGAAPKKVTQAIIFDVPAYGIGSIVDVNGNTGVPNPITLKVGDVIRFTYKASSPAQTISASSATGSTVLKAGGATFDGTTYSAVFSGNQPGNTVIGLNISGGNNSVFQVTVALPDPAP